MKTRLFLTIIAIILISNQIYAQNSFEYIHSGVGFKLPAMTIETNAGDYIFCFNQLDSSLFSVYFQLTKLSKEGELIKTQTFLEPDSISIYNLIVNSDSTFLALGIYYNPPDSNEFAILCINNDLEILYSKKYFLGERQYGYIRSNFNKLGNIVFSSMANIYDFDKMYHPVFLNKYRADNTVDYGMILYELSPQGDSIKSKTYTDTLFIEPYQIVEKPDKLGYYLFGYTNFFESFTYGNSYLTELDYDFNPIQENVVPLAQALSLRTNAKNLGDSTIIYTGRDFYQSGQRFETVTVVDNELNPIATQPIIFTDVEADTNVNLSHQYNLDFVDPNNIYISGIYNFEHIPYQFEPSWVVFTNLDSMLNIRWQKYFGGDAFYFPWSTLATSDGSCILLGYRWDYKNPDFFKNEIFVFKVDSLGNLTTIYGPEISTQDIQVFPNPGKNYLNVSISPDVNTNKIMLYNIIGMLVLEYNMNSDFITINTSTLKPGIYFYKIYSGNQLINSGKWIKQ